MPSHRDGLGTPLETLRSCSLLPKNGRAVYCLSLAQLSSQEFCALSIWLKPVLGRSQAFKVPHLVDARGGVHDSNFSTWRRWSPVRRSAHVLIPTNGDNNLALGRQTNWRQRQIRCSNLDVWPLTRKKAPCFSVWRPNS